VTVLVDNRFDQATHPVHQLKFDWYQSGVGMGRIGQKIVKILRSSGSYRSRLGEAQVQTARQKRQVA